MNSASGPHFSSYSTDGLMALTFYELTHNFLFPNRISVSNLRLNITLISLWTVNRNLKFNLSKNKI
jgi:hypothetical protein